jgi:MreB/Mbl protein
VSHCLATDYCIARGEVNSFVEIDMAGESLLLCAMCRLRCEVTVAAGDIQIRSIAGLKTHDLGTANTLIYAEDEGIVCNEPSVVALHKGLARRAPAIGAEAKKMLGRTPGFDCRHTTLKDGVVADFEITETLWGIMQ